MGKVEADLSSFSLENSVSDFAFFQRNTLIQISPLFLPEIKKTKIIEAIVTGYSSTPWETEGDPFITAFGTRVREGVVANNFLPFGTRIKIPEIFGDKIFFIEDRMHWRKGKYQFDVWFENFSEALNFGAKRTIVEILE